MAMLFSNINLSLKALGDNDMTVEGYASTFWNEDQTGDIIERGAFDTDFNKKYKPKMLAQHRAEKVIGKWLDVVEDTKGLYVKGQLCDTEDGIEYYKLLKQGAIDSFSIGFNIPEPKTNVVYLDDYSKRIIKKINLYEISVVTFPCNLDARVTGVKNVNEILDIREFERMARRDVGLSQKEAKLLTKHYKEIIGKRDVNHNENSNVEVEDIIKNLITQLKR